MHSTIYSFLSSIFPLWLSLIQARLSYDLVLYDQDYQKE